MDDFEDQIVARLNAVRAEFDLMPYRALGDVCGATTSQVNNWVNGSNLPRVQEMSKLCEQTGITLDWLCRGHMGAMNAGVSEFLCVRLVQFHPPLGERL